jgi:dynein heavy chain 1
MANLLKELETCPYNDLSKPLTSLQNMMVEFHEKDFSNLDAQCAHLNECAEKILSKRLVDLQAEWVSEFVRNPSSDLEPVLCTTKFTMNIAVTNSNQVNSIILEPSIQEARAFWYKEVHDCLGKICNLNQISQRKNKEKVSFDRLLNKTDGLKMGVAYESIERKFVEVYQYVDNEWRSIEMLWNLNTEIVCQKLVEGGDITKWGGVLD